MGVFTAQMQSKESGEGGRGGEKKTRTKKGVKVRVYR